MIIFEEVTSQVTDAAGPILKVLIIVRITLPTGPIAILHILGGRIAGLAFGRSLAPAAARNGANFALVVFDEFVLIGVTEPALELRSDAGWVPKEVLVLAGVALSAGLVVLHKLLAGITSLAFFRGLAEAAAC